MKADQSRQFVNQLFMLIKTAQIHDPQNRAFQLPLQQFRAFLEKVVPSEGALTLETVDVGLYLNEAKIRSDISTFMTYRFMQELFEKRVVGGIRILRTPSAEDLTGFLRVLLDTDAHAETSAEALNALLESQNNEAIEFLPRVEKKAVAKSEVKRSAASYKRRAVKNYVKAIDVVKNATLKQMHREAELRKAKRVVYDLVDICLDEGFSFFGLSNIKTYDEYTYNHSVNVCIISIAFGKNLGLSKKQIGEMGIAGLYHDYGKLEIPHAILNKPGRFNAEEWEVMKTHPHRAIKRLLDVKGGFREVDIKKMIAAFEHHRNYDCSGYPQTGIKKPLSFYSRVVQIADCYDAMTTNRVYQRGMLPTVALKILLDNAGTKFDPLLVKAFIHTVGVYPVGSLVRLTNNSMAVVTGVDKDPDKLAHPTVIEVADPSGNRVMRGRETNLAEQSEVSVAEVLRPEEHGINVAYYLLGDALEQNA